MLSITRQARPLQGLGISLGIDTSSIASSVVNAVMPAIAAQMPNLVAAAWPSVQSRVPDLITSAVPQITAQIPTMMDQAMPTFKTKVLPMMKTQIDVMVDNYARRYLGAAYIFKNYYPALAILATSVTLFASGLVIYQFWAGEK